MKKFEIGFALFFLVLFLSPTSSFAALPAFPGAEGFGSQTQGGRGGKVIQVTNTNDSGPGSLREALSQSGPRIVVFKVGGLITLQSYLTIANPYVTIAGQTAPGEGIALRGAPMVIKSHDIVIRGMKFRYGIPTSIPSGNDNDNLIMWDDGDVYNIVIDHNSFTWGLDENLSTYNEFASTAVNNVTISNNILAEALRSAGITVCDDAKGHSYGALINSRTTNLSMHHNLLSSNCDRNPNFGGLGNIEFINNVVWNWGKFPTIFNGGNMNAIGNNYISSSGTSLSQGQLKGIHVNGIGKVYLKGNIGPGRTTDSSDEWGIVLFETSTLANSISQIRSTVPVFGESRITTTSAQDAYNTVVGSAGPIRDSVDTRIIRNLTERSAPVSGKWIIYSQNDVGGYPVYSSGTSTSDSDNDGLPDSWDTSGRNPSDITPSGYTWIEEYVNSYFSSGTVPSTSPAPTTKTGDANDDGLVNEADYNAWNSTYVNKASCTTVSCGDFDKNSKVDGIDYMVWLNNYGK